MKFKFMFKKTADILFLLFIAVILSASAAFGDVIWTPADSFFDRHYEECEYVNRTYIANGFAGYIRVYKSPENQRIIDSFENGNEFYISHTYDSKGKQWGVIEYELDNGKLKSSYGGGNSGWVDMSQFVVRYDNTSFTEEHEKEFVPYDGSFDINEWYGNQILFWTYPGSGVKSGSTDKLDGNLEISHMYTDENGREWGYSPYYYGVRQLWICLSDPTNENLPVTDIMYENLVPPAKPEPAEDEVNKGIPYMVVVLVVFVVVVTAVMLKAFMKK